MAILRAIAEQVRTNPSIYLEPYDDFEPSREMEIGATTHIDGKIDIRRVAQAVIDETARTVPRLEMINGEVETHDWGPYRVGDIHWNGATIRKVEALPVPGVYRPDQAA